MKRPAGVSTAERITCTSDITMLRGVSFLLALAGRMRRTPGASTPTGRGPFLLSSRQAAGRDGEADGPLIRRHACPRTWHGRAAQFDPGVPLPARMGSRLVRPATPPDHFLSAAAFSRETGRGMHGKAGPRVAPATARTPRSRSSRAIPRKVLEQPVRAASLQGIALCFVASEALNAESVVSAHGVGIPERSDTPRSLSRVAPFSTAWDGHGVTLHRQGDLLCRDTTTRVGSSALSVSWYEGINSWVGDHVPTDEADTAPICGMAQGGAQEMIGNTSTERPGWPHPGETF